MQSFYSSKQQIDIPIQQQNSQQTQNFNETFTNEDIHSALCYFRNFIEKSSILQGKIDIQEMKEPNVNGIESIQQTKIKMFAGMKQTKVLWTKIRYYRMYVISIARENQDIALKKFLFNEGNFVINNVDQNHVIQLYVEFIKEEQFNVCGDTDLFLKAPIPQAIINLSQVLFSSYFEMQVKLASDVFSLDDNYLEKNFPVGVIFVYFQNKEPIISMYCGSGQVYCLQNEDGYFQTCLKNLKTFLNDTKKVCVMRYKGEMNQDIVLQQVLSNTDQQTKAQNFEGSLFHFLTGINFTFSGQPNSYLLKIISEMIN